MPTYTKAVDFIGDMGKGVHDLSSDNLIIVLSNTAPASESSNPLTVGNGVIANITPISYTNYTDNLTVDRRLENVTWTESGGTWTLNADDVVMTGSGGDIAAFQYIYICNDTATGDPVIGLFTLDAAETVTDGSDLTITINASGIYGAS